MLPKMKRDVHVQYPLILPHFNRTSIFSTHFRIILKYQVSRTIRPVGAELLHASGRTNGHDEANGRFSQFCEGA